MIRYILILFLFGCSVDDKPTPVTELSFIKLQQTSYQLQWPKDIDATHYLVETVTTSNILNIDISPIETNNNIHVFEWSEFFNGSVHHRITPCNADGCGDPGKWILIYEEPEFPAIPYQIDVLIVYDNQAYTNDNDIDNKIFNDFIKVNDMLINNELEDYVEFNLIIERLDRTFNWPRDNTSANDALVNDVEIQELRDYHKADVVIGINTDVNFPGGGTGKMYIDSNRKQFFTFYTYTELEQEAYATVAQYTLGSDNYVLLHEMLHTFGLQHDLQTEYIDFNVSAEYPYAHGLQNNINCTIMARGCARSLKMSDEATDTGGFSSSNKLRFMETVPIIADFR